MSPIQFYTQEKAKLEKDLLLVKRQLKQLAFFRFLVFVITAFGIYYTFNQTILVVSISVVGVAIFLQLLFRYLKVSEKKELLISKIDINKTELKVLNGDVSSLDSGEVYINSKHAFSYDIDLFGEGSFYQYLNRTVTKGGSQKLAELLTENEIESFQAKQNSILDLAKKVKWRQQFSALAGLIKVETSSTIIVDFIAKYSFVFSKNVKQLPLIFSILSLVLIGLVSFQILPFSILTIWFILGLVFTGFYIKKTQKIYSNANKAKDIFKQYYQLLNQIENEEFSSEILKAKQKEIQSEQDKASQIFLRFSKILDAFDQRNNVVVALLGNGLFLWDLRCAVKVESWIEAYMHTVEKWFKAIAFFDAQNSLANFCFNHPSYVFPTLVNEKKIINAEMLGHPLLSKEKRVDNNFTISSHEFFIVTGANMAGKSTFLRTVSLSIVMANMGLPVCAKKFEYTPIKLITSMRTSDSLAKEESYFYSELKRLKFIVDKIELKNHFIILDEILKGTNSKDKAIGSKKFVERLVKSQSTGIIATHDVSLCELEKDFSEIENYFFDAQIIEDELHFDYTLKKGVCNNMNASFLLSKMKIT